MAGVEASAIVMMLRKLGVVVALCGIAAAGCDQELRVPYIAPKLANWPQPYRGVAHLTVHVFNTGYLRLSEALILRGGSLTRSRDLPVPAYLIEHPTQGLVLFNTGLSPKPDDTSSSPTEWLSFLLPREVLPGKSLTAQMQAAGLSPAGVRWVILSSLRFDHTGEIEAFPNARVVVAKTEHEYALRGPRGYVPGQFADVASWKFIDFNGAPPLATLAAHVDLFGDGSCLLLDVHGSTPGTMALLIRLREQPLLLADDLAPVAESIQYAARPATAYDLAGWWEHIWRLKKFKDLVPELVAVPGHDLAAIQALHSKEIVVHPFDTPGAAHATPTPGALQRLMPRPL